MPAKAQAKKCACTDGNCKKCACGKKGQYCDDDVCHGGVPNRWCLNNPEGELVKSYDGKTLKQECIKHGLGWGIGSKADMILSLVALLKKQRPARSSSDAGNAATDGEGAPSGGASSGGAADMIGFILENQYDYAALLSLSGMSIVATSATKDMRKAYLLLSRKCHPDKNQGNPDAKKAFQALVTAFDLLSQPELADADGKQKKERAKQKVFVRGNDNECHATRINCPRCHMLWYALPSFLDAFSSFLP
jgi:hypothetical protein